MFASDGIVNGFHFCSQNFDFGIEGFMKIAVCDDLIRSDAQPRGRILNPVHD